MVAVFNQNKLKEILSFVLSAVVAVELKGLNQHALKTNVFGKRHQNHNITLRLPIGSAIAVKKYSQKA